MKKILGLFVAWRGLDLLIAYIAKLLDKSHDKFPMIDLLDKVRNAPPFLRAFANFDGIHYIHIARYGYNTYEQAFFPLFPLLIHFLQPISGGRYFWTGFVISNLCFLGGLIFWQKYLLIIGVGKKTTFWSILFLLVFPTSFFFGSVYPSGLFLLIFTAALYFLEKRNFLLASIFSFFAPLERLIGLFIIIPSMFKVIEEGKIYTIKRFFRYFLTKPSAVLLFIAPILGLGCYMLYLYRTIGDPLFFYSAQPAFGANRSTHIILLPQVFFRYIKIFLTARHDVIYFVSWIEFAIFNLVFWVLIYELYTLLKTKKGEHFLSRLGLNLFSLTNIILPTLTGTLSSIPRYAFVSLSFFIVIGEIKNIFIRLFLLVLFAIFHIIILTLFIQGNFVG